MKEYILAVAGAVLLSAALAIVAPSGKMGKFVKGMTKLVLLVVLLTPFFGIAEGKPIVFDSAPIGEDEAFLTACDKMAERDAEEGIEAMLFRTYNIGCEATAKRGKERRFEKISVKITDFGIYGQDRHIDMIADVKKLLEEAFGCEAEVL